MCMKNFKYSFAVWFFATLLLISGCTDNQSTDENATPSANSDATISSSAFQYNGNDYSQYAGTWAQAEIDWLNGGVILDISVEADMLQVIYTEITGAPISNQAEICVDIPVSNIQGDRVETSFDNDGWDNAGTMSITFDDDQIICKIADVHYVGESWDALWSVTETTVVLVPMDNAHSLLEYDLEDYYEIFPDENPDNWIDNPSTASSAAWN